MNTGAYGSTSGTDEREARPLMSRLMTFDLGAEISRLRSEEEWLANGRSSVTLAKEVDFRVMLSVLRDGELIHEDDGDARVSLHVLEGRATVAVGDDEADLQAGELAAIDVGHGWELRGVGDCAVLLTFAWPREKAGV